jgi:3-methyladenine DNA glycosylase AlkD
MPILEQAMKTVSQVMTALKKAGTEQTRKTFARHGAPENFFGVKVADLKVIAKKIKGDQELACELYETGNADAMYLAGIVADGSQMSKKQLENWAKAAPWHMIAEYSVPGVANESPRSRELAMKWIKSKKENVATAGWNTYAGIVAIKPDEELDLKEIESLLKLVESNIDKASERVKYTMNGFVISVGGYVKPLAGKAKATAKKIGKVEVNMGDTACKVPLATEYIAKMEKMGRAYKKRKTTKC